MLITEEVEVTINTRNKKYLKDLGYDLSKYEKENINKIMQIPRGTKIKINVFDLQRQSVVKINVLCDYCLENVISKQYNQYLDSRKIVERDCCNNPECMKQKRNEVNFKKYGFENPLQREEIKQKEKQSNIEKYGFENVFQCEEIKNKSRDTLINKYNVKNISQAQEFKLKKKETFILRYGVDNPLKNKEIQDKVVNTNLAKYGVPYIMMSQDMRDKSKDTFIKKYGVSSLMKLPNICNERIEKGLITFYLNKTVNTKTSKQQLYLCNLLKGELNYPIKRLSLDIAFPQEKIYVEYDGSGHNLKVKCGEINQKEFNQKELERGYFLSKLGWKRIRIVSTAQQDWLPQDIEIIKMVKDSKEYLNSGHSWIEYNIDENKVKCSQYEENYDFGKLRKIKKEDNDIREAI